MTDNDQFDILFDRPEPITPASTAPNLNELRVRVSKRRRQRKLIAASVLGGTVLCLFTVMLWRPELSSGTDPAAGNEVITRDDPSIPRESPISLATAEASGVRVFAKVWHQIPIFGLEEETQYLHLVGWIDSEEVVPVDLSQFPSEQQESIEAVLHNNDPDERFNL